MVRSPRSGRPRSTPVGHERYGRRRVAFRLPLPVVVIVCDDSKTAPAYFDLLKRELKQRLTLTVVPAKCQESSPRAVVDLAIQRHKELKQGQAANEDSRDAVWVMFDLECTASCRKQADAAASRATKAGVKVALSDPCYEVWTLLHLEDTGVAFGACSQVVERIRQLWKDRFGEALDKKTHADYSKIIMYRHEAAALAKRHWQAEDPSRTEVYKIIDYVDSVANGPEKPSSAS